MTGKSRRGKGKYSIQSKKKKGRPRRPTMLAQQSAAAQAPGPASSPKVPVPSTPVAKPALVRYPYTATELRTSVILAGVMLIVLVVLALVLS